MVRGIPDVVASGAGGAPGVDGFWFCGDIETAEGLLNAKVASAFWLFSMSGYTSSVRAGTRRSSVNDGGLRRVTQALPPGRPPADLLRSELFNDSHRSAAAGTKPNA
jgi:hypothetical protein